MEQQPIFQPITTNWMAYLWVTGDINPIKTYADMLWKWKKIPFRTRAVNMDMSVVACTFWKSIINIPAGIWTIIEDILVKNCNSAGLEQKK